MRFTQAGAVLKEDSLTRVETHARVRTASLELASADYRTLQLRPQPTAASSKSAARSATWRESPCRPTPF